MEIARCWKYTTAPAPTNIMKMRQRILMPRLRVGVN
jgi:hypothetical protein